MSETKNVRLSDLINVYDTEVTLPTGTKLGVKPITTGQLKSLLIYENETNPIVIEDALDRLISSSVTTPEFNIDNLTLHDRMDLMLELRNITKGSLYSFTHTCDKCKMDTLVSKDLRELVKIPINETELYLDINDRLTVVIGFPTRLDQKKSYMYQGALNEDKVMTSTLMLDIATTTMAYAIKDVIIDGVSSEDYQGDEGISEKIFMLENIPRNVHERMTKFFHDNRYGTEFDFKFNCIHCGKEYNMTVPINDFFV